MTATGSSPSLGGTSFLPQRSGGGGGPAPITTGSLGALQPPAIAGGAPTTGGGLIQIGYGLQAYSSFEAWRAAVERSREPPGAPTDAVDGGWSGPSMDVAPGAASPAPPPSSSSGACCNECAQKDSTPLDGYVEETALGFPGAAGACSGTIDLAGAAGTCRPSVERPHDDTACCCCAQETSPAAPYEPPPPATPWGDAGSDRPAGEIPADSREIPNPDAYDCRYSQASEGGPYWTCVPKVPTGYLFCNCRILNDGTVVPNYPGVQCPVGHVNLDDPVELARVRSLIQCAPPPPVPSGGGAPVYGFMPGAPAAPPAGAGPRSAPSSPSLSSPSAPSGGGFQAAVSPGRVSPSPTGAPTDAVSGGYEYGPSAEPAPSWSPPPPTQSSCCDECADENRRTERKVADRVSLGFPNATASCSGSLDLGATAGPLGCSDDAGEGPGSSEPAHGAAPLSFSDSSASCSGSIDLTTAAGAFGPTLSKSRRKKKVCCCGSSSASAPWQAPGPFMTGGPDWSGAEMGTAGAFSAAAPTMTTPGSTPSLGGTSFLPQNPAGGAGHAPITTGTLGALHPPAVAGGAPTTGGGLMHIGYGLQAYSSPDEWRAAVERSRKPPGTPTDAVDGGWPGASPADWSGGEAASPPPRSGAACCDECAHEDEFGEEPFEAAVLGFPGAGGGCSGVIDLSVAAGPFRPEPEEEPDDEPSCCCCAAEASPSAPYEAFPPAAFVGAVGSDRPAGEIPADSRGIPDPDAYNCRYTQASEGGPYWTCVPRVPTGYLFCNCRILNDGTVVPNYPGVQCPVGHVNLDDPVELARVRSLIQCAPPPPVPSGGGAPVYGFTPGTPSGPPPAAAGGSGAGPGAGAGAGAGASGGTSAPSTPSSDALPCKPLSVLKKQFRIADPPSREWPGAPWYVYTYVAFGPTYIFNLPPPPTPPCGYEFTGWLATVGTNFVYQYAAPGAPEQISPKLLTPGGSFFTIYAPKVPLPTRTIGLALVGPNDPVFVPPVAGGSLCVPIDLLRRQQRIADPPSRQWPGAPWYVYTYVVIGTQSHFQAPPPPTPPCGYVFTGWLTAVGQVLFYQYAAPGAPEQPSPTLLSPGGRFYQIYAPAGVSPVVELDKMIDTQRIRPVYGDLNLPPPPAQLEPECTPFRQARPSFVQPPSNAWPGEPEYVYIPIFVNLVARVSMPAHPDPPPPPPCGYRFTGWYKSFRQEFIGGWIYQYALDVPGLQPQRDPSLLGGEYYLTPSYAANLRAFLKPKPPPASPPSGGTSAPQEISNNNLCDVRKYRRSSRLFLFPESDPGTPTRPNYMLVTPDRLLNSAEALHGSWSVSNMYNFSKAPSTPRGEIEATIDQIRDSAETTILGSPIVGFTSPALLLSYYMDNKGTDVFFDPDTLLHSSWFRREAAEVRDSLIECAYYYWVLGGHTRFKLVLWEPFEYGGLDHGDAGWDERLLNNQLGFFHVGFEAQFREERSAPSGNLRIVLDYYTLVEDRYDFAANDGGAGPLLRNGDLHDLHIAGKAKAFDIWGYSALERYAWDASTPKWLPPRRDLTYQRFDVRFRPGHLSKFRG